jgi:hypothetical protein
VRTACSPLQRVGPRDARRWAAADARLRCAAEWPDRGASLTRPALERHGTIGAVGSFAMALDVGGAKGRCGPGTGARKSVRSHVENGAVNGMMASTISHDATNLEVIRVRKRSLPSWNSKRCATPHRPNPLVKSLDFSKGVARQANAARRPSRDMFVRCQDLRYINVLMLPGARRVTQTTRDGHRRCS